MERFNLQKLALDMTINWMSVFAATVCGTGALFSFWKWRNSQKFQRKILNARKRRDESFQQAELAVQRFKTQNPDFSSSSIVSLSLSELSEKLKDGSLQPEAVLYAFMEKALEVNKDVNCNTEMLMDSVAQLKDISTHKKGLLYGVPISIKDNISYKGHDTTCGVVTKLDQPVLKDSVVVSVLKKQGAIPFVKTNIPQGLLVKHLSVLATSMMQNSLLLEMVSSPQLELGCLRLDGKVTEEKPGTDFRLLEDS